MAKICLVTLHNQEGFARNGKRRLSALNADRRTLPKAAAQERAAAAARRSLKRSLMMKRRILS